MITTLASPETTPGPTRPETISNTSSDLTLTAMFRLRAIQMGMPLELVRPFASMTIEWMVIMSTKIVLGLPNQRILEIVRSPRSVRRRLSWRPAWPDLRPTFAVRLRLPGVSRSGRLNRLAFVLNARRELIGSFPRETLTLFSCAIRYRGRSAPILSALRRASESSSTSSGGKEITPSCSGQDNPELATVR